MRKSGKIASQRDAECLPNLLNAASTKLFAARLPSAAANLLWCLAGVPQTFHGKRVHENPSQKFAERLPTVAAIFQRHLSRPVANLVGNSATRGDICGFLSSCASVNVPDFGSSLTCQV